MWFAVANHINRERWASQAQPIYGLLRFASFFLFDRNGQSTQLLPYIRPVNEVFAASGPDGFPRAFISIILPTSKAHAPNGFLKTPV